MERRRFEVGSVRVDLEHPVSDLDTIVQGVGIVWTAIQRWRIWRHKRAQRALDAQQAKVDAAMRSILETRKRLLAKVGAKP